MALRAAKINVTPRIRTVILCLLMFVTASGLPSCAVTDFVSAFFNTYYNAQNLFDQAEAEVFSQLDSRPGGRSWLGIFGIQTGTKTKLESVIEKCSKLLQYHPDSKLVDDALLMIGKAYYYEDDNQQAIRKFNEIISGYPNGSCAVEARLLLSYAQYRMKARDDARTTALAVVEAAKKSDEPAMISRASLVLGQMAQEDKDYSAAREFFDQAAQFGSTPEERSSASLMSADMYRKMGKFQEAEDAYLRAAKASNNYAGEFRGRMGAYRMKESLREYDEALKGFRLLRADAKNKEFFGEIELEVANTYRDMGDLPGAVDHYTLVDTTYPRSETSSRSYFALGDLYEHVLYRYDSALVAYAKGRNEYQLGDATQLSIHRSDYLTRYFQYHTEILKCDTLLAALIAFRDTAKKAAAPAPGTDSVRAQSAARAPVAPPVSIDSVRSRREIAVNELAGLFFVTINLPDSAEFWYQQLEEDNPRGRFVPRALYSLAQIHAGRDSLTSKPVVDSLYREILRRFPKSDFAPEARRLLKLPPEIPAVDDAEKAYTRAEKLMIRGDSSGAVEDFKKLAREYPSSPLASRALYAAGWIYENRLSKSDSAIAAYTRLMTLYPASLYAARVSPKISEVNQKMKDAAAADSLEAKKLLRPSVRTASDSIRARGVADSISIREEVFRPKPVPGVPDTSEAKKNAVISPRRGPGKEGIPP